MRPTGEKPDATTLALVGFNVSLAWRSSGEGSPCRPRSVAMPTRGT